MRTCFGAVASNKSSQDMTSFFEGLYLPFPLKLGKPGKPFIPEPNIDDIAGEPFVSEPDIADIPGEPCIPEPIIEDIPGNLFRELDTPRVPPLPASPPANPPENKHERI